MYCVPDPSKTFCKDSGNAIFYAPGIVLLHMHLLNWCSLNVSQKPGISTLCQACPVSVRAGSLRSRQVTSCVMRVLPVCLQEAKQQLQEAPKRTSTARLPRLPSAAQPQRLKDTNARLEAELAAARTRIQQVLF